VLFIESQWKDFTCTEYRYQKVSCIERLRCHYSLKLALVSLYLLLPLINSVPCPFKSIFLVEIALLSPQQTMGTCILQAHSSLFSGPFHTWVRCTFLILKYLHAQSSYILSGVSFPSSELGPPHPLSRKRLPPPPGTKEGGTHSPAGDGLGVPIRTTAEKA
jgi:hypothetical protein